MAITKKFTGRDWAYTLLDNPFMARVMEKKDFQAMTDEDWEWLISKDKQFAEIRAELKARFGGKPIKKVKSVKKRSAVKKASITRKASAVKKKGAVKRKVAKRVAKKYPSNIKKIDNVGIPPELENLAEKARESKTFKDFLFGEEIAWAGGVKRTGGISIFDSEKIAKPHRIYYML